MNVQEAKGTIANYSDLVGKTVRCRDLDYVVQDIVVIPTDSPSLAEMTAGYKEDGFAKEVEKIPSNNQVEIGLLCTQIIDGSTAILKVTEVEFLL